MLLVLPCLFLTRQSPMMTGVISVLLIPKPVLGTCVHSVNIWPSEQKWKTMTGLVAHWVWGTTQWSTEEAKLKCPPPSSPHTLAPSVGPKSDLTAFGVSRHLKGHDPTLGPCDTDGSVTVLLLIDASLRSSPDVPDILLNKNCVFLPFRGWPHSNGGLRQPGGLPYHELCLSLRWVGSLTCCPLSLHKLVPRTGLSEKGHWDCY